MVPELVPVVVWDEVRLVVPEEVIELVRVLVGELVAVDVPDDVPVEL